MKKIFQFYRDVITKSKYKGELNTGKKKFRFITRTILYLPQSLNLAGFIQNHKYLSKKILSYPVLISKIHRPYLCNLFSVSKRLISIKETYNFIDTFFPKKTAEELYEKGSVTLAEITGTDDEKFQITLSMYPNFDKEGELSLKILNSEKIPLTTATFSFIKENGEYIMFLGGLQGPHRSIDKDCIKHATKSLSGIFPKRVVMEALYAIEHSLDMKFDKFCVGNGRHVYVSRRYLKKRKILASYDDFMKTLDSIKTKSGLWKLPNELIRKNIADIPSKKRGEYRRRYSILDSVNKSITENFI